MYHPSINQCIINQSISETSINQYLQLLIGSCWSPASNQVKKERIELKIMKPNLERMQIAKELKSNFSKPNHKDITTVNSNKKVKTKPKTITKLSKTKQNKAIKPNHKAKPKPLPSLIVLQDKFQVSRRLAERDQLQHNQLCNYRGGTTCALCPDCILAFSDCILFRGWLQLWLPDWLPWWGALLLYIIYNWPEKKHLCWFCCIPTFVWLHSNICLIAFQYLFNCLPIFVNYFPIFVDYIPIFVWLHSNICLFAFQCDARHSS